MKFPKGIFVAVLVILLIVAGGLLANRLQEGRTADTREGSSLPRVQVEKPQRKSVSLDLQLHGDVLLWEQATLYSKVAGYLSKIRVDKGDWVKKGTVLALI